MHDFRVAQIEDAKKFQTQYNKLLRAYRQMTRSGASRNILTPQEQALLDKQQHYGFSDLSQEEQQKLSGEVDSLFGQIPEHLQKKARDMAGVN